MNYKKWLYSGLLIFFVSTVVGLAGTVWNIYAGLEALELSESAGIGSVGLGIENALYSTILGLLGAVVGVVLVLVGVIKAYQR